MKRKKREEWERHVELHAQSGERVVDYCRRHGLNPKSFSYWRSVLKREETPQFVPVGTRTEDSAVEFHHPNGVVIKASSESGVATFRRILEALGC